MKTIMLVCAAGMSTSLLVTKMREAAKDQNIEADIFANAASELDHVIENKNVDVVLLGPQVKFMKDQIAGKLEPKGIPVESIDMQHYGMMNGVKVLEQANRIIDNK
jgi:PTS system cellobiose-specific IIB component